MFPGKRLLVEVFAAINTVPIAEMLLGTISTVTAPVLPFTLVTPPLEAVVAVAALPVMLMPQLPLAPVPVGEGTSVPMARPRLVRAADAVVAFVPPLAIGSVPTVPASIGKPVAFVNTPLVGVPNAPELSTLVATAVAMLLNSVSISVPLTILRGSPDGNESLVAKLVLFV